MKHFRIIALLLLIWCLRQFGNAQSTSSPYPQSNRDSVLLIKDSIFPKTDFQWISYQMKIDMTMEEEKLQFQCFVAIRTDSIIYLNLNKSGIELARVVLTPKEVVFVNKMEHKYYQGDYSFFQNIVGIPLDYLMVQSLLLATDFPHFENNFQLTTEDGKLQFISPLRKQNNSDLSIMQSIQIGDKGVIEENDMTELKTMRDINVKYDNYVLSENVRFFSKMLIEMETDETILQAEIKNVKVNRPGPTGIKIPENFEEIIFEK